MLKTLRSMIRGRHQSPTTKYAANSAEHKTVRPPLANPISESVELSPTTLGPGETKAAESEKSVVTNSTRRLKSGVKVTAGESGALSVETPNGYKISRSSDGELKGVGPDGQVLSSVVSSTKPSTGQESLVFTAESGHEYSFNTKSEALAVKDPDGMVTQTLEKNGGQDIEVLKAFEKEGKRYFALSSLQIDPIGQSMSLGELSAEGKSLSFRAPNGDPQTRSLVFAAPEQKVSLNDLTSRRSNEGYILYSR